MGKWLILDDRFLEIKTGRGAPAAAELPAGQARERILAPNGRLRETLPRNEFYEANQDSGS